ANPKGQALATAIEPKARGANRSTKVAGKLKVLPEHAEPVLQGKSTEGPPPPRDKEEGEGSGTLADSEDEEGDDEEEPEDIDVYNQIDLIPAGTARRDALRLTKKKAKSLPRVTAYATASSYRFPELMKFFNARRSSYHTNPRAIDDVIYTPYVYDPPSEAASAPQSRVRFQTQSPLSQTADLLGVPELAPEATEADGHEATDLGEQSGKRKKKNRFSETPTEAEIFMFEYGTVVIWGMTEAQEKRFLSSLKRFEVEKLAPQDVEMEDLNYYYANYSRIYNDVITLRKGSSYMSVIFTYACTSASKIGALEGQNYRCRTHCLSRSKFHWWGISVHAARLSNIDSLFFMATMDFEKLISTTIDDTKDIPEIISETGKIDMKILRKIGELFLLRTNINSVGSVLDSPFMCSCIVDAELFSSAYRKSSGHQTYPDLQPLYDAARSYLEIPQRINLLNTRVEVLQDMLQLFKETVTSRHAERLEQIVIALIVVEIGLGIITIIVDLFS
ncbi:Sporulation protein RMD1, partial [Grifola frondosa]